MLALFVETLLDMKIISMRSQNMSENRNEFGVVHLPVEKPRSLTRQIIRLQLCKPFFIVCKR